MADKKTLAVGISPHFKNPDPKLHNKDCILSTRTEIENAAGFAEHEMNSIYRYIWTQNEYKQNLESLRKSLPNASLQLGDRVIVTINANNAHPTEVKQVSVFVGDEDQSYYRTLDKHMLESADYLVHNQLMKA